MCPLIRSRIASDFVQSRRDEPHSEVAIAVLAWTLQVYPFDFSAYDFPIVISAFDLTWDLAARLVIGLAIVGTAIAVVTETVKLSRALDRT